MEFSLLATDNKIMRRYVAKQVYYMENTEIKVSVVMPIYNALDYLRPALDSVVDQTLREIEIICIDDGSTDKSLGILKEYQQKDSRIRIVTQNNAGPSAARNKGITRARGEYIAFLDADDFYEPTLLETLYGIAKKDDLDIAVSRYDIYNSRKSAFTAPMDSDYGGIFAHSPIVSKNEYPDYILQATTGYVWNKLFKREFLLEKELHFIPEFYVFEDVHFVVTCLAMADKIGKVSDVLVHHRVYSDQARAKMFRRHYAEVPAVYAKIKEYLMQNGMYAPLSRSFLNLSAGRCYTVYNLLWHDAKENFWSLLHNDYAETLGWHLRGVGDFERREVCEFVMNVVLYDHTTYIKRLAKGIKLRLDKFATSFKNVKLRKKISSIFHRKKK